MAIPGQYQYPTTPGVPPPPAGGGTPPPATGGGGTGADWWTRLFGTANVPDWLKELMAKRQAGVPGRPSFGLFGEGGMTREQAAAQMGWPAGSYLGPTTPPPDLRVKRPTTYPVPGAGWTGAAAPTVPAPTNGGWSYGDAELQKLLQQAKGFNAVDPQPASQGGGGSSYFGGSTASSAPAAAPASGFGGSSGLGWLQSFLGR